MLPDPLTNYEVKKKQIQRTFPKIYNLPNIP